MSSFASWTHYVTQPFLSSWNPLIITLCITTLTILTMLAYRRPKHLPPGPLGLPFVGYLPFLGKEAYRTLFNMSEKYGPIISLYLGRRLVVVLNTFELVKEALSNPVIMDRPPHPPNHLMRDSVNLAVSNGAVWKEQRNFAVQALHKLGMGKEVIEDTIGAEIHLLQQKIDSHGGQPMNLATLILPSVSNVMLSLLNVNRDRILEMRPFLDSVLKTMTLYFRPTRVHAYFPALRQWMARWHIWGYDEVEEKMKRLSEFIKSEIDHHRSTLDPDNVRDYIDAFLLVQKESKNPNFTDKMLRGNVQSLMGAGSTPARAALEWCLVSAAMFPEVQRRVHQELQEELGSERPTWADRNRTPYTMAVMMEAMRHYTVVPISMLRTNTSDCSIGGYEVPSGTIIMTNIWAVHHDPERWERPDDFWPEHFLKDGKLIKPSAFIPFSYGRRNCPGEDMALMEVYLYFASLVQRYRICPAEGSDGFKTLLGIANMVVPDNICMVRRTEDE